VVPSRTLETFILSNFGLPPDRVVFIPNGVDIDRFRPLDGSEMRKRLGIGGDEIVFGIVANLRREKRLDVLFRGLHQAKLKSWRLLVAGDGPCRPDLLSLASELQISDQLLWAGSVKDTVRYYAAMDVFVLSSETEQMPVSLLEAMACGKAVIVTDVGDCRSVLAADGPPVVVPPNDPGSLADALRGMHASAELRAELGLRNRSRCVEHFSHERMMSRYIELYEWASGRKF
jgi:glycosyltransferase involved in cell wall biosynthesis